MDGIWQSLFFLGYFLVAVIVIFVMLKVLTMLSELSERMFDFRWIMNNLPFFFFLIPVLIVIIEVFNAGDVRSLSVSSTIFDTLVVEWTMKTFALILAWTIAYISLLGLDERFRRNQ